MIFLVVYDVGRVMHSARGARWCGCAVARAIRCGSASAPGTVVAFSTMHSEESLNARVVFPKDLHSEHYYNGETLRASGSEASAASPAEKSFGGTCWEHFRCDVVASALADHKSEMRPQIPRLDCSVMFYNSSDSCSDCRRLR